MIQGLGEAPEAKLQFNNKCLPRYFADEFLLPWCKEAVEGEYKSINPEIYLENIREAIKKIDKAELKRK